MTSLCKNPYFDRLIEKVQRCDMLELHEKSVCVAALRSFSGELTGAAAMTLERPEQAIDVAVSMLRATAESPVARDPSAKDQPRPRGIRR